MNTPALTPKEVKMIQAEAVAAVENLFAKKPTYPESYCELFEGAAFWAMRYERTRSAAIIEKLEAEIGVQKTTIRLQYQSLLTAEKDGHDKAEQHYAAIIADLTKKLEEAEAFINSLQREPPMMNNNSITI